MRILIVSPFYPWPLDAGGKIRIFSLIKYLSQNHQVTLACLSDEIVSDMSPFADICESVHVVQRKAAFLMDFIKFIFGKLPFNAQRFFSKEFKFLLETLVSEGDFDLVQCEFSFIWSYMEVLPHNKIVLDAHNIEFHILEQLKGRCGNPFKRVMYQLEADKMRNLELSAWRGCRLCLAVSENERQEMISFGVREDMIVTVPNGVDIQRFAFAPRQGRKRLLFLCGLDYAPNMDAARWLLTEIWPLILSSEPSAELVFAGRGTLKLAEAGLPDGVSCIGNPVDVPECFASADMMLVPLRVGGGTRLKVLEGMAAGLPVIATSKGSEGVGAVNGEHLLIADSAKDFADACLRLMAEPLLTEALAKNGRNLVEDGYCWGSIAERLSKAYESAFQVTGRAR